MKRITWAVAMATFVLAAVAAILTLGVAVIYLIPEPWNIATLGWLAMVALFWGMLGMDDGTDYDD